MRMIFSHIVVWTRRFISSSDTATASASSGGVVLPQAPVEQGDHVGGAGAGAGATGDHCNIS